MALIVSLPLFLLSSTSHAFEPDTPNLPITEESDLDDSELYDEAIENDLINENLQDEAENEEGWE